MYKGADKYHNTSLFGAVCGNQRRLDFVIRAGSLIYIGGQDHILSTYFDRLCRELMAPEESLDLANHDYSARACYRAAESAESLQLEGPIYFMDTSVRRVSHQSNSATCTG
jgi:hypothetical protein